MGEGWESYDHLQMVWIPPTDKDGNDLDTGKPVHLIRTFFHEQFGTPVRIKC